MVNVHEAKSTLSELLKLVESGERVIVARAGTPVADLVPHRKQAIVFGTAKGEIEFDEETFDDPEPINRLFEGR
jgi:prevent-host-death family protein